jgi:hypothetical protein
MKYEITTKPAYKFGNYWAYEASITVGVSTMEYINVSEEKLEGDKEDYAFNDSKLKLLEQVVANVKAGTVKL